MSKILKSILPRRVIYRIKKFYFYRKYKAKIYSDKVKISAVLGKNVQIWENVYIGDNVSIGDYSYIGVNSRVESGKIGKYCSIASNVVIGPYEHPIYYISTHPFLYDLRYKIKSNKKYMEYKDDMICPPNIGNDVWIGTNSIILRGVKIGDGAVIGAGAVVTKNVEPFSIVGGIPAKHIKYRFPEVFRKELLEIKWWDWPEKKIRNNIEMFYNAEKFIKKFSL
ncbi:DapH/DapD/GlmU-related protein [Thermoanaerobacterium saccharolyticum]|uniref:DapH/DapD/GlmU-related protein n=1 Tax=Thermoanaerobacterium saccharolyticum TaxID=28896 RepID=UPI002FD8DB87